MLYVIIAAQKRAAILFLFFFDQVVFRLIVRKFVINREKMLYLWYYTHTTCSTFLIAL